MTTVYEVVWTRGKLGISFRSSSSTHEPVISRIDESLQHQGKERLKVKDKLVSINGLTVKTMSIQDVMSILKSEQFPKVLHFQCCYEEIGVLKADPHHDQRSATPNLHLSNELQLKQLAQIDYSGKKGLSEYDIVWVQRSLGLSFIHQDGFAVVSAVRAHDNADVANVHIGDTLVMVSGLNAEALGFKSTIRIVCQSPKPLHLRFKSCKVLQLLPLETPKVELNLPNARNSYVYVWEHGPLGLAFKKNKKGECCISKSIISSCAVGDVLVSISGMLITTIDIPTSMGILKQAVKPVELYFESAGQSFNTIENNGSEQSLAETCVKETAQSSNISVKDVNSIRSSHSNPSANTARPLQSELPNDTTQSLNSMSLNAADNSSAMQRSNSIQFFKSFDSSKNTRQAYSSKSPADCNWSMQVFPSSPVNKSKDAMQRDPYIYIDEEEEPTNSELNYKCQQQIGQSFVPGSVTSTLPHGDFILPASDMPLLSYTYLHHELETNNDSMLSSSLHNSTISATVSSLDKDNYLNVTWKRGQLGIQLYENEMNEIVVSFLSGSDFLNNVAVGDILVKVANVPMSMFKLEDAMNFLQTVKKPTVLTFQKMHTNQLKLNDSAQNNADECVNAPPHGNVQSNAISNMPIESFLSSSTTLSSFSNMNNNNNNSVSNDTRSNLILRSILWSGNEMGLGLTKIHQYLIISHLPSAKNDPHHFNSEIEDLNIGDTLYMVNEVKVSDIGFKKTVELLQTLPKPMKLTFQIRYNIRL